MPRKSSTPRVSAASPLSKFPLLRGLPPETLREIERAAPSRDFRTGFCFFRAGELGRELYLLEEGSVRTYRTSGTKTLIIAELDSPEIFGEMSCVGQGALHCSADAIRDSRVRVLSRPLLDSLFSRHPVLVRRLLDLVGQRFVHVLNDLDATSFRQLIPRIAALLLARAQANEVRGLTHKAIAEHLRVYRESATAALGELRAAGILQIRRMHIRILDLPRLQRAARE